MQNNQSEKEFDLPELANQFLEYQKIESVNRSKELDIRDNEIKSNEKVALASLEVKRINNEQQAKILLDGQKYKHTILVFIVFSFTLIVVTSMITNQITIALELIKISGSILVGYFIGLNKEKYKQLENKNNPD